MALVTISRNLASGGTEIAQLVAKGLAVDLYDDNRLRQEAAKLGVRSDELAELDEKSPGFFEHLFTQKPQLYLDLMESVVYEVARKGQGVIMGHGAQLLLREFSCALHVLVHAPEGLRVQKAMDERGLSREGAEKLIRKSDHEQRGFLHSAFHMDWSDPKLYDLVVNTQKVQIETAANLIVQVAGTREVQACGVTALDAMERLALEKRIQAALLRNNYSLSRFYVEVPSKGVAYVAGFCYTVEDKDRLLELVKSVPGVAEFRADISVTPTGY
jgi:cytidylate kinase